MTKMYVSDSWTVAKWLETLEKHFYNAIEILPMTLWEAKKKAEKEAKSDE